MRKKIKMKAKKEHMKMIKEKLIEEKQGDKSYSNKYQK